MLTVPITFINYQCLLLMMKDNIKEDDEVLLWYMERLRELFDDVANSFKNTLMKST